MNIRQVEHVHTAPRPHWVGDGFHVNPMFNHMVGDKRTDPFLMLDYASPQYFVPNQATPRGVGQHPHKGFETVTIAYKGEVAHRDSTGGGGIIKKGDVQWMTAGNGIIHEEFHSDEFSKTGGDFEMVQLWVNLPAKDKATPAKYQLLPNEDIPVVSLSQNQKTVGQVRVIAGEMIQDEQKISVIKGLGTTFSPINLWDMDIDANSEVSILIPSSHNLILLIRQGDVLINDKNSAKQRELVTFEAESDDTNTLDSVRIRTGENGAELVLMSGVPLNEPIVGYGPFVMNTEAEIRQAVFDFNAGKFGQMAY